MTEIDRRDLPDLFEDPPEDTAEARDRVEAIRGYINEEVEAAVGAYELEYELARLYVEWALEHVENLDTVSYTDDAETALKNIIFHL